MQRNQSIALFGAGVALMLAYLILNRIDLLYLLHDIQAVHAIVDFFSPGAKYHPFQWLIGQGIILAFGALGVAAIGFAVAGNNPFYRPTRLTAFLRTYWREAIWVCVLGGRLFGVISVLGYRLSGMPGFPRGIYGIVMRLWGYFAIAIGVLAIIRLLFRTQRSPVDAWIGYAAAAVAFFNIASVIPAISLMGTLVAPEAAGSFQLPKSFLMLGFSALSGVIGVWIGFTLARGNPVREDRVTLPALNIVFVLLSAMFLGKCLGTMLSPSFLSYMSVGGWSLYAMTTPFAVFAVMVAAQAISTLGFNREMAGAPADGPARQPLPIWRSIVGVVASGRFWIDLVVSAGLSGLLAYGGFMGLFSVFNIMIMPFIMPLFFIGVFIGPMLIFVYGGMRRRPGILAGPICLALAATTFMTTAQMVKQHRADATREQANTLNIWPPAQAGASHQVVAIEASYFGVGDGVTRGCGDICMQILLKSDYAVAIQDRADGHWRVFKKATDHATCVAPDQLPSYLHYLQYGYARICATMSRQASLTDALVIRENFADDKPFSDKMPGVRRSAVMEFYERRAGKDRLLGQLITSSAEAIKLALAQRQGDQAVPMKAIFYGTALNLPNLAENLPIQADREPAIRTLADMVVAAPANGEIFDALGYLGMTVKDPKTAEVIRQTIVRFWTLDNPKLNAAGLRLLYRIKDYGLGFAKRDVERLLGSDDVGTMKAAVSSILAFDHEDTAFAFAPFAAVMLSPRVQVYGDDLGTPLEALKIMPGPFPSAARAEAKRQFASAQNLSRDMRAVLLAIVGRGGPGLRQEAVGLVFAQSGAEFEQSAIALSRYADCVAPGLKVIFWSEDEMHVLVAHAADVPNDRLAGYIDSFRYQMKFKSVKDEIADLLDKRIAMVQADPAFDKKVMNSLTHVRRNLDR